MNWGVIGHDGAVNLLSRQIQRGRVSHAYLFTGPEGVGRRTLALHFAQALNCPQPLQPGEPCRECRTCTQIETMQQADLSIVRKPEDRTRILIDQIRELQRSTILTPHGSNYRIALCLNFEEATEDAQNAFLKTLEEAPAKLILLNTAESPEALLPTIVSRCEVLRLRPMAVNALEEHLRSQKGIDPQAAHTFAHFAQGRPGWAFTLCEDPAGYEQHKEMLTSAIHLLHSSIAERFHSAEDLFKKRNLDCLPYFKTWITLWSDLLALHSGDSDHIVNVEFAEPLGKIAQKMDIAVLRDRLVQQQKAIRSLDRYVNARLQMEVLLLDWPIV